MKRILILALVLALLGAMVISGATFAKGPGGHGDGSQAYQGDGHGDRDGGGPILTCTDVGEFGSCGFER